MGRTDMPQTADWTRVVTHATVATCAPSPAPYGLSENSAVALAGERIAWVGPATELPAVGDGVEVIDAAGALLTPGLIDCHTHLVFAGNRAQEFELRQQGASYEQIARSGGGILATVTATREASEEQLLALALQRARVLMAEGITCVEIKSGYGLDLESELKLLRIARRVGLELPLAVHATLLAAHTCPPEFSGRADDYIDLVVRTILPAAAEAGLVDSVDAFCERIAFSPTQVRRLFDAARRLDIPVRLHAEQLSNLHGAELAAGMGALSADHLEYLDEAGAAAMARSGTVAVLLPGAFYYLGETRRPPVELLRRECVPIAIGSDFNPGSSPLLSLRLAMNMACTLFGLTPEEALCGVTRNAARALGTLEERGTIEVGKLADLVLWDTSHPAELAAEFGTASPSRIYRAGQLLG
jgi:imidazolonepropionase